MSIFLSFILTMFFWTFIYLVVGFGCFYLGRFLRCSWLMRFGHSSVAYGDASNFGAHKKWIARNCPRNRDCMKCKYWTCGNYRKV